MANYYTHFSCLLYVGTPENAARALDLYNALSLENAAEDPPSEAFLLSIESDNGGTQLWIRDDVTGDPEQVIQFVKRCATEFGLTGLWGFPRGIAQGEMPPIFVLSADGEPQIVNSRVHQNILIVDQLFGAAELRLGSGVRQQVVRIVRIEQTRAAAQPVVATTGGSSS